MKATILIDNITKDELNAEWGLAVYVEYEGTSFLLDAGTTGIFAENSEKLSKDLSKVSYAMLSHAHYDHADGFETFFLKNKQAKLFLREDAKENCYHKENRLFRRYRYIGIKKGLLEAYKDRIQYVSGDYKVCEGVYLIGHKTPGLSKIGEKCSMYVKMGRRYMPDNYGHEQSLVFELPEGLVIFNSCSHGGIENIIREVQSTFPNRNIIALVGGLHLYRCGEQEVLAVAEKIKALGIQKVITGHCTGDDAFGILKKQLGDVVEQIYTGMELHF